MQRKPVTLMQSCRPHGQADGTELTRRALRLYPLQSVVANHAMMEQRGGGMQADERVQGATQPDFDARACKHARC